jgi:hypothetical protein
MSMLDSDFRGRAPARTHQSGIGACVQQPDANVTLRVNYCKHEGRKPGVIPTVNRLTAPEVQRDGIHRAGFDCQPEQRTELFLGRHYRKHGLPVDGKKGGNQVSDMLSLAIKLLPEY